MTTDSINVEFDDEWLEEYRMENIVISPITSNIGAVVASKKIDNIFTVNIFQLQFNEDTMSYYVTAEITSFSFLTENDQQLFTQSLP